MYFGFSLPCTNCELKHDRPYSNTMKYSSTPRIKHPTLRHTWRKRRLVKVVKMSSASPLQYKWINSFWLLPQNVVLFRSLTRLSSLSDRTTVALTSPSLGYIGLYTLFANPTTSHSNVFVFRYLSFLVSRSLLNYSTLLFVLSKAGAKVTAPVVNGKPSKSRLTLYFQPKSLL